MKIPEWIIGQELESSREWIVHATRPRFIVHVACTDNEDPVSGYQYVCPTGEVLTIAEANEDIHVKGVEYWLKQAASALDINTLDAYTN